jgi:hypothetical protein
MRHRTTGGRHYDDVPGANINIVCKAHDEPSAFTHGLWIRWRAAKLIDADQEMVDAKAAKVSLDGSPLRCVCVEGGCVERCSNAACAYRAMGRTASGRFPVRCQCVGPTIPDPLDLLSAIALFKPAMLSYRSRI